MTRNSEKHLLREVRLLLEHAPGGLRLEDIVVSIPLPVSPRTIQRRLAMLVDGGWIERSGKARATRYFLPGLLEKPVQEHRGPLWP